MKFFEEADMERSFWFQEWCGSRKFGIIFAHMC